MKRNHLNTIYQGNPKILFEKQIVQAMKEAKEIVSGEKSGKDAFVLLEELEKEKRHENFSKSFIIEAWAWKKAT